MNELADLSGHRILVVEDDYLLATDTARAVEEAGAEVIGPCADERAALGKIEANPTGALVDVDLGGHSSFDLARALMQRGVPMVFVTGYDASFIPKEFDSVSRLQKPAGLQEIVGVLADALSRAAAQ